MRVVLDTNVVVSGLLNPHGAPGRVIDLLPNGQLVALYDDRILDEYRDVPLRPGFGFDPRDVKTFSGAADALITGNWRHFVPVRGSHRVPVYTPQRLLSR